MIEDEVRAIVRNTMWGSRPIGELEDEAVAALKCSINPGVGMPAALLLEEFGSQVWAAFGDSPYLVGSALLGKEWRDVDVRLILFDDAYADLGLGDPMNPHCNAKWVSLCLAYSALGKALTGLPIDFQIQQWSHAKKCYPSAPSQFLGLVPLRIKETFEPRRKVGDSMIASQATVAEEELKNKNRLELFEEIKRKVGRIIDLTSGGRVAKELEDLSHFLDVAICPECGEPAEWRDCVGCLDCGDDSAIAPTERSHEHLCEGNGGDYYCSVGCDPPTAEAERLRQIMLDTVDEYKRKQEAAK